mgnify:FL=1
MPLGICFLRKVSGVSKPQEVLEALSKANLPNFVRISMTSKVLFLSMLNPLYVICTDAILVQYDGKIQVNFLLAIKIID